MAVAYMEHYTLKDYQRWEGDWELIEGVPYAMSPFAFPKHQRVSGKIFRQLDELLEECKECVAFMEAEVILSEDTVVRPDSFVYCHPYERYLDKVPSIIFEVVSPSSSKRDEVLKFELYQSYGVPYYVLVYPQERVAKVFKLDDNQYQEVKELSQEKFSFDTQCPLEFDFSRIWE